MRRHSRWVIIHVLEAGLMFGIRAGDWVEVMSLGEILATLDDHACLDALPYMPEMVQYSGRRFRVYKSAHKTCDTIERPVNRRMTRAVHLEGLRCDGEAHAGCQAGCLLFWKEAWLRPMRGHAETAADAQGLPETQAVAANRIEVVARATRVASGEDDAAPERYRCQATEMLRATEPLKWWDLRQYAKDLVSRNVRPVQFIRYVAIAVFNAGMRMHWRGRPYLHVQGLAGGTTPIATLNLQPGELVQVRSRDEIMRTLNANQMNRGLWFDVEMIPFCGRTYRVLRRVEKIINEKTGVLFSLPGDCIILENVTCGGCLSRDRLFCPRSIYPYWREIWLTRVE